MARHPTLHLLLLLLRHQLLLVFSLAAFGVAAFLFPVGIRASRQDSRTRRGNGSALFLLRHTKRGILVSIYAHNPHQSRGDERERTREEQRERMRTKERKRKRGSAREFKMREKRSLKKVAAMGPSDGRRQSLSFSVFEAIFRSRSRSRESRGKPSTPRPFSRPAS